MMKSDLQVHGLWPIVLGVTADATAKRLLMQHLGDDVNHKEGFIDGGYALWNFLAAGYKDRMAFKQPYMVNEMETL